MTTCPNCGRPINDEDVTCPNCHFDLQKYRETFFTDQHQKANFENEETGQKIASRKVYRQEFYPEKQNSVIERMLQWIHVNSMIAFLLGIALLILMSFSRSFGWICFFALLVWLYFVCSREEKIDRYTVDERLTQKINQIGSNMFNDVAESKEKVKAKSRLAQRNSAAKTTVNKKKHFSYVQLLVVLMAVINLIVLFTGSGASVLDVTYGQKMSITRVVFGLAGRLFSSNATLLSGVLLCVIWLIIVLIPLFIIYHTMRDTKKSRIIAFLLSLIETIFLIYVIYRMSNTSLSNRGILHSITSQLLLYAVSVGASTYFLILASVMTTGLTGYNLFHHRQK